MKILVLRWLRRLRFRRFFSFGIYLATRDHPDKPLTRERILSEHYYLFHNITPLRLLIESKLMSYRSYFVSTVSLRLDLSVNRNFSSFKFKYPAVTPFSTTAIVAEDGMSFAMIVST